PLSGLGAATADMFYGAIAAFGLTAIMDLLTGQAGWLRLFGGIFLVSLGIRTIFSKPAGNAPEVKTGGMLSAYFSTLILTLTNPMTILSFMAIFAGALPEGSHTSPMFLVAGVFSGSAAWWLALSLGVGMIRRQMNAGVMTWINRISGAVILVFGMFMVAVD
ncbi:MAG: LysE family translocator, partial [Chloroflexi bacterium]|nr:LysE family translocator [Chloroflexota bacterium]